MTSSGRVLADKDRVHGILHDAGDEWQDYMLRLKDFEAFLAEHCPHLADDEGRCIYHATREIAGLSVGIAGFNSAWSCGSDDDKSHLWLGEWQLKHLSAKLMDADVRIALVHHPFNWLVESEDRELRTRFQSAFHVLLHGHEHQLWVETPQDDHLHIAAGAVLDRPDAELGYNVVRFDVETGEGEVWLRTFDRRVDEWKADVVPRYADGGVWRVPRPWRAGSAGVSPAPGRGAALLVPKGRTKIAQDFSPGSSEFPDDLLSRVAQICTLREGERARIARKDPDDGISYLSVQCRDGTIIRDFAVAAEDVASPSSSSCRRAGSPIRPKDATSWAGRRPGCSGMRSGCAVSSRGSSIRIWTSRCGWGRGRRWSSVPG